jgi:hypothetical protein
MQDTHCPCIKGIFMSILRKRYLLTPRTAGSHPSKKSKEHIIEKEIKSNDCCKNEKVWKNEFSFE